MRTKIVAFIAVLALSCTLLCPCALASECPFEDIKPSDSYYDAVLWALENEITSGTSSTAFSPGMTCTRGQVVTFLWRACGRPEPHNSENPFTDVPVGAYFETAVRWAVENEITNGTTASTFSPDKTCTCAHILTFIWRANGHPEPGAPSPVSERFPDDYYSGALSWAEYNGLLDPEDGSFDIHNPCSRSLTVTYLHKASLNTEDAFEESWNPTVIHRQVIFDSGSMCGAVLVGCFTEQRGEDAYIFDRDFWDQALLESGLLEDFDFLTELPGKNIVQTGGGREIYLIIPLDPYASVTVNQWICNEANGYVGEAGEVLYKNDYGEPFLLCCNRLDSVPDTQIVIVDGDGEILEWNPRLSLHDGMIVNYSEGKTIYDFTRYAEEAYSD